MPRGRRKQTPAPGHRMAYYRYRLYPTRRQARALEEQLDFACDLYNAALEQRKAARRQGIYLFADSQKGGLTELRHMLSFPEGMNTSCQQEVLERLDLAFRAAADRYAKGQPAGWPRRKTRWRYRTLVFKHSGNAGGADLYNPGDKTGPGPKSKEEKARALTADPYKKRLYLQGIGLVKVRWHRLLPDDLKLSLTRVSIKNGRWYVTFVGEVPLGEHLPSTGEEIGIDLGVRELVAMSNGELRTGPRYERTNAESLAEAQRVYSRRQPGSNRRRKQALRIYRKQEKVARARRDHAHKVAAELVRRFDVIYVENLNIRALSKGSAARDVRDAGWARLVSILVSQAEGADRKVVFVNPRYTSQTCSSCHTVAAASRKDEEFRCVSCGHEEHADINAAKNVLRLGQSRRGGGAPPIREAAA